MRLYAYFDYFDEFIDSQKLKTEKLHGKSFRRIKYGDEDWLGADWSDSAESPCHDCGALKGQFHLLGCDVERCPRCKDQLISCGCKLKKDYS